MNSTNQRYTAIDGLRAFSAIGILMMHVAENGNYAIEGFIYGRLIPSFTDLVFLFMIVSAFGMCCGYFEKFQSGQISVESFYKKRFLKVLPYFACLVLLEVVLSPSKETVIEAFADLTLCFGLLPNAGNISVIGVGWFLGLIFVFYFLFPFFCFLLGNKKRAWFAFVVAIAFNVFCTAHFEIARNNILYSFMFFMAGGLIYLYRQKLAGIYIFSGVLIPLLAIAYFMLDAHPVIMLALYSATLAFAIGINRKGLLNNPVAKFLSNISLEIYLSHMVIYRILEKLELTHLFSLPLLSYMVTAVATLAGTIGFALALRWVLEKIAFMITKVRERKPAAQ